MLVWTSLAGYQLIHRMDQTLFTNFGTLWRHEKPFSSFTNIIVSIQKDWSPLPEIIKDESSSERSSTFRLKPYNRPERRSFFLYIQMLYNLCFRLQVWCNWVFDTRLVSFHHRTIDYFEIFWSSQLCRSLFVIGFSSTDLVPYLARELRLVNKCLFSREIWKNIRFSKPQTNNGIFYTERHLLACDFRRTWMCQETTLFQSIVEESDYGLRSITLSKIVAFCSRIRPPTLRNECR